MHIPMSYGISQCPKSQKSEFPQLPGQYPETFCYIEHCTVLYSAEYQYPSEYKDFFKLGSRHGTHRECGTFYKSEEIKCRHGMEYSIWTA